ncbi:MAG: tyrosine--tRNA ligase [Actinomycetota bacterium]|jgi:tyrosyl-tRNA synthetase|nr:tyrosine--tRNA ligase [Actinomycetota bacterium]
MPGLADDLRFRGLVHQVTDPSVLDRLDGERLTVYGGFDPTSDSLHVGNLLQLCTLRRLQLAGHRPIALAGGGTGFIGDPGGKSEERTLLSAEELAANVASIRAQLARFLDFEAPGPDRAVLLDNVAWLGSIGLLDFLREVGKQFTVGQMVAKESVRARLEREGQGISYTEFSYMLLQAYDFRHLYDEHDCRLQIGGSDQWGNITMGVELVRRTRQAEVWGLTSPLVVKADGTKFGKTEVGTVWLDAARTSPYQLYQFFLRSEDAVVGAYLRFFTFLGRDELLALDEAARSRPERREAARTLARAVCALVHGEDEAVRAERAADALYSGALAELDARSILEVLAEAPTTTVPRTALGEVSLVDLLVTAGVAPSRTRARTTVEQGGCYVNDRRETDPERRLGEDDVIAGRYVVLRRGKREYHLVELA